MNSGIWARMHHQKWNGALSGKAEKMRGDRRHAIDFVERIGKKRDPGRFRSQRTTSVKFSVSNRKSISSV